MADKSVVGFAGLGLMGTGFLKRLIAAGHPVIGYDVVAEKCRAAQDLGAEIAPSIADMARRADIVACSVTTPANVGDIVAGAEGLTSAGDLAGKVFIDHSTTPIELTRELGERLTRENSMAFIDAPVSGGPAAAEAGTLAIMAGGEAAAIEKVRPVMEQLGTFTHMGELGAGQATKLINKVAKQYPRFRIDLFAKRKIPLNNGNTPAALRAFILALTRLLNSKQQIVSPYKFCEHIFDAEWQNMNARISEEEARKFKDE